MTESTIKKLKNNTEISITQEILDDIIREQYVETLSNIAICNKELLDITINDLELKNVYMCSNKINDCIAKKAYVIDSYFENVDFSNSNFSNSIFKNVKFNNCKFTGCRLNDTKMENVEFVDSKAKYANFVASKFKNVSFKNSEFIESAFQGIEHKNLKFEETNLSFSELIDTKLYGLDLTTVNINGITVSLNEVKGAIVTQEQALALSRILGLIVKE